MKTLFIWGAGGVGKSHCALRIAARSRGRVKVLTLDPSRRLFHLAGVSDKVAIQEVTLAGKTFELVATDAGKLFEELDQKRFSKPGVKLLYEEMVRGLKDFRNYLDLVQIGDEIQKESCDLLIIDTPPFQEAVGLHRAILHLQRFFETSLITWAMRISDNRLMQGAVKRVFSFFHFFSGKGTAQRLFEFISWLAHHSERFARSAKALQKLMHSPDTESLCIVHGETSYSFLETFHSSFPKEHRISFLINRSLEREILPHREDAFIREMKQLQDNELRLRTQILKVFPQASIDSVPLILMGEDSAEELERFASVGYKEFTI